jgi:branched-chain amino acid transport system substrate-binding protein
MHTKGRGFVAVVALIGMMLGCAGYAQAQAKEVVIGFMYPMTGPSAQIGIDALNMIKVAVDIINNDVNVNLPLGKGAGLPNLGGAVPSYCGPPGKRIGSPGRTPS